MSKEVTDQMDALMGGERKPDGAAKAVPDDYEKTKHELDNARGRCKTLDARVKELERENAALRASRSQEDLVSSALTEEERQKLDPVFLTAAAKIAAASEERIRREREERDQQTAQEREERESQAKEDFKRLLASKHPGFFESVAPGGEKAAAWADFMSRFGASVNAAYARRDENAVGYFVDLFNSQHRDRVPSGSQGGATSPSPRNLGSGASVQPDGRAKTYTPDEYAALEKQAMAARRRGDFDAYRKLNDELKTILAEGRVKDE